MSSSDFKIESLEKSEKNCREPWDGAWFLHSAGFNNKMVSSGVEEILSGPLVQWFVSCLEEPDSLVDYNDLVEGVLLHRVFLQIDPEPLHDGVIAAGENGAQRAKNLEIIVSNIRQFYEGELGHLIIKQPDTKNLGKKPEACVDDARLLLLLLLGCAVQCPNKEKFITGIKTLNLDTQLAIVDCIKRVTDRSEIVVTRDYFENANTPEVFDQMKDLLRERDLYKQKWKNAGLEDRIEAEEADGQNMCQGQLEREGNLQFAAELADWKSKFRKQRQKLDERSEALLECKEELERNKAALVKLKQENQELKHAARTVQSYKDELDAVIERAERADRLESEVQKYREKLTDIEFYKTRIEELREDNRVLIENREVLEEQVSSLGRSSEKVLELQAQINDYEQLINCMTLENTAEKEKCEKLFEENCELYRLRKIAADEAALAALDSEKRERAAADNSLSEQLTNDAQARVLKLELENLRLNIIIDSFKQNSHNETSSPELQREEIVSSTNQNSSDENERLPDGNCQIEFTRKEAALEENEKLQNILRNERNSFEQKQQEYENNYETIVEEKRRLQLLLESATRRADELNQMLETSDRRIRELEVLRSNEEGTKAKCDELEAAISVLEKEREISLRDSRKFREIIEEKDMALDKSSNSIDMLEKEISRLRDKIKKSSTEISRTAIDRETLESLRSNLATEKLNNQRLNEILQRLGLRSETLLTVPLEDILEKIAMIDGVIDRVKRTIAKEAEVDEKKSKSEFNGFGNVESMKKASQLTKASLAEQQARAQLVKDYAFLKSLHEKLNSAYENVVQERDTLKQNLKKAENATEALGKTRQRLEMEVQSLNVEKETATAMRNSLKILRSEHSKLKEDFVSLYNSMKKLKSEHKNLRESYNDNRLEINRLRLMQTEMLSELSTKDEKCATMEVEMRKVNLTSEMLLQVNFGLESNRRSLMDHLSQLFNQYHELLVHSFEDKEHYHMEEKLYTDRVNHLYRQKEKLEEKIMDHYRKMDNSSLKKKRFGASFVQKVRKAGSELLNKNRNSSTEDEKKLENNDEICEFQSATNDCNQRVAELEKSSVLEDKISRWMIKEQ